MGLLRKDVCSMVFDGAHCAVVWDLHGVLFTVDSSAWILNLSIYGIIATCIFLMSYFFCGKKGLLLVFLPIFFIGIDFVARVGYFYLNYGYRPVIEHVWDSDVILRLFKPHFVRFENLYRPNEEVFALIKNLQQEGCDLFIGSNIAPDTLRGLKEYYPVYFDFFKGIISPHESNGWVDKKQPELFFALVKAMVGDKHIIFIDDSSINCQNAQKNGLFAIRFMGNIDQIDLHSAVSLSRS